MTQKWILEHRFRRLFENKFEFRARDQAGVVKDRILRGVFVKTAEDEFSNSEIKEALTYGIIKSDKIIVSGSHRNVYLWLTEECKYQPIWHKRMWSKLIKFIGRWV